MHRLRERVAIRQSAHSVSTPRQVCPADRTRLVGSRGRRPFEAMRRSFYAATLRALACIASLGATAAVTVGCGGSIATAPTDAGDAARDASPIAFDANDHDGALCSITRSNYDESCSSDSDCLRIADNIPVDFGNYCEFLCRCGGDAINRVSASKFAADVMSTPLGAGALDGGCSCGGGGPAPCCRQGQCVSGGACAGADVSDASNNFGTDSPPPPGSVWCSAQYGPFDAAAPNEGPGGWCPGECSRYNIGWACCTPTGVGALCIPYPDAGE
jgi:hypothetical protein